MAVPQEPGARHGLPQPGEHRPPAGERPNQRDRQTHQTRAEQPANCRLPPPRPGADEPGKGEDHGQERSRGPDCTAPVNEPDRFIPDPPAGHEGNKYPKGGVSARGKELHAQRVGGRRRGKSKGGP